MLEDEHRLLAGMKRTEVLPKRLLDVLERSGELAGRQAKYNLLHSLVDGDEQDPHWDWNPNVIAGLLPHARKPRSGLLALDDHTKLIIFENADDWVGVEVMLRAGEVLLFDADVLHAGAAYTESANTRLHVYLDVEGVTRVPNSTWKRVAHATHVEVLGD